MKQGNIHETGDCRAVSGVLARIGDKWSVLIVSRLGARAMRFGELKRDIGGISQRMLTLTLRGLERDGLVTRTVFMTIPPRVDYALTALGRSLLEPVSALRAWALANIGRLETARAAFDAAAPDAAPKIPVRPAPSAGPARVEAANERKRLRA
ncbi:MAG: helix-turn-helix domain-containing protein [Rhizomicrobium sp.]